MALNAVVTPDDWRLTGQERFLQGRTWTFKAYRKSRPDWDHDHCNFCQAKFIEPGTQDVLSEGFSTQDDYYWICRGCFDDFKVRFDWSEEPAT